MSTTDRQTRKHVRVTSISQRASVRPSASEPKKQNRSSQKNVGTEDTTCDLNVDAAKLNTRKVKVTKSSPLSFRAKAITIRGSRKLSQSTQAKLAGKKKKNIIPVMTIESMYTKKAIQLYQSDAILDNQAVMPPQYQKELIQSNLKAVRDHWKARSQIFRRSGDSDSAIVDIKESIVSVQKRKKQGVKMKKTKKVLNLRSKGISTTSVVSLRDNKTPGETPRQSVSKLSVRVSSISQVQGKTPSLATVRSTASLSSKHRLRRIKSKGSRFAVINRSLDQFRRFQIPGVKALRLNGSTQNLLGITPKIDLENPWFLMDVDDVLDNVKKVKNYSEALKVLEVLVPYAEEEILMGYFTYPNMFLVCTTPEARDRVISMLEEDIVNDLSAMETKICRTPFRWLSFGSEKEIQLDHMHFRSLYQIRISIINPVLYREETKFKMRMVEQSRDGYVELLCLRRTFDNIYRSKLDAATQTIRSNISVGTKSSDRGYRNIGTQYHFESNVVALSNQQVLILAKVLQKAFDDIHHFLLENSFMYLHSNDYQKLKRWNIWKPEKFKEIVTFSDLNYCQNKTVSLVVWNPWISGNIAVVYSETKFQVTNKSIPKTNPMEENYILIWDYNNPIIPQQLLFSEKTITTVSFCPHDSRVIIGGTATGDILIWLLPDFDEKQNTVQEILTERMYENRLLIAQLTSWIKNLERRNVLKVKAYSSTHNSHRGYVKSIKWLLPDYKITSTGTLSTVGDGEKSLQFLTCGEDGCILIWNVPQLILESGATKPRKTDKNTAERYAKILKEKTLMPTYKLEVFCTRTPNSLAFIHIPNQNVRFKAVACTSKKTKFESFRDPVNEELKSSCLYLATVLGCLMKATWESHEFRLKEAHDNLIVSQIIHDGPITVFEVHPLVPDLVLTVGGKILAVWYMPKMRKPFFWRKRSDDLLSGFWSLTNPEEFTVATSDAVLETWNFLWVDRNPLSTRHVSKFPICTLFNDVSTEHAHENTLVITDNYGLVRVISIPEDDPNRVAKEVTRETIEKKISYIYQRRDAMTEKFRREESVKQPVDENVETTAKSHVRKSAKKSVRFSHILTETLNMKPPEKKETIPKSEQFKKKEVQYSIAIMKEKIMRPKKQQDTQSFENKDSFKENLPCEVLIKEQANRKKMLEEKISSKRSVVNRNVDEMRFLENTNVPKKLPDVVPSQNFHRLKTKMYYLEEYENIEESVLNQIKWNKYSVELNWMDFLDRGKSIHLPRRTVSCIDE